MESPKSLCRRFSGPREEDDEDKEEAEDTVTEPQSAMTLVEAVELLCEESQDEMFRLC